MAKSYDPAMHSAEHVLNGVMVRRFGCARCFSTHINPGKSKVDFRFPRDLSPEEARAVEDEVNAELSRGLAVSAGLMPREEAARRFNLSRLPADAGDELRISMWETPPILWMPAPASANMWKILSSAVISPGVRMNLLLPRRGRRWAFCACVSGQGTSISYFYGAQKKASLSGSCSPEKEAFFGRRILSCEKGAA